MDLKPSGAQRAVTDENKLEYLDLLAQGGDSVDTLLLVMSQNQSQVMFEVLRHVYRVTHLLGNNLPLT